MLGIPPLLIENGLGLFVFQGLNSGLVLFKLVLIFQHTSDLALIMFTFGHNLF